MWFEFGIIQIFESPLHIVITFELTDSSSILVNIGINNFASLPHVVFQILPTSRTWEARDQNTMISPSDRLTTTSWSATATTTCVTSATTTFPATTTASPFWCSTRELDFYSVAIKPLSIFSVNCIFSISLFQRNNEILCLRN